MADWFHINAAGTNTYPSGDMTSRDLSRTTTAANSAVIDAAMTTIKGVQIGPGHSATGTLDIRVHDSATVIRSIDLAGPVSATNMAANANTVEFSFPGPWTAVVTTAGNVDVYLQYESSNVWRPTV